MVAFGPQCGEKRGRWDDAPTASENGFDENCADVAGSKRIANNRHRGVERRFVSRIRRKRDMGVELGRKRLPKARIQSTRGERTVRQSVVAAFEGDDSGAARRKHGGLQACAHGVRTTRPEHDASARLRKERGQTLTKVELGFRGVQLPKRKSEPTLLFGHGSIHEVRTMTESQRSEACGEIDVAIAVDVHHVATMRRRIDDWRLIFAARELARGSPCVQGRALHGGQTGR